MTVNKLFTLKGQSKSRCRPFLNAFHKGKNKERSTLFHPPSSRSPGMCHTCPPWDIKSYVQFSLLAHPEGQASVPW